MKYEIVLEINGVRHKLIKTRTKYPCEKCSVKQRCTGRNHLLCYVMSAGTHFRKCKKGE